MAVRARGSAPAGAGNLIDPHRERAARFELEPRIRASTLARGEFGRLLLLTRTRTKLLVGLAIPCPAPATHIAQRVLRFELEPRIPHPTPGTRNLPVHTGRDHCDVGAFEPRTCETTPGMPNYPNSTGSGPGTQNHTDNIEGGHGHSKPRHTIAHHSWWDWQTPWIHTGKMHCDSNANYECAPCLPAGKCPRPTP